jgi:hypothetical protein
MKCQIRSAQPFLFIAVVSLILILISACTSSPTSTQTPTIDSEKAIELAISGCKKPHLVLVGDPTNIQATLLSLEEADKLTKVEGETANFDEPMDTKVWLVQMNGQLQLSGGPEAVITLDKQTGTPTPPQPFIGTCIAILEASSGNLIYIRDKK